MPVNERMQRVAELEFERAEEALIMRAHGDGIDMPRRPDAAPACVLNVIVVAKAAAAA
jgi:hypothetical protein